MNEQKHEQKHECKNEMKKQKIQITEICPENLEIIEQAAALEAEVFSDAWSCREVESTVKQKHSFCAAAVEGDTLLGYFLCYYVLDEGEIARIAVKESARRCGIGQMLMEYMAEVFRGKEITKILLDVRKSNRTAIVFYEKNGFKVDGERRGYYGGENPEDAVLMSRIL